jgi:hypothetical protein
MEVNAEIAEGAKPEIFGAALGGASAGPEAVGSRRNLLIRALTAFCKFVFGFAGARMLNRPG